MMERQVTIQDIIELSSSRVVKNEVLMEVLELDRVSVTPCYESKWVAKVKDRNGAVEVVYIQRFDIETKDNLKRKIEECKDFREVKDLWVNVYFD